MKAEVTANYGNRWEGFQSAIITFFADSDEATKGVIETQNAMTAVRIEYKVVLTDKSAAKCAINFSICMRCQLLLPDILLSFWKHSFIMDNS